MIHVLKIIKQYADQVIKGNKMFEVRLNDRCFQKGDYVQFVCIDSDGLHPIDTKAYEITYVLSGFQGLTDNYVAFGIKELLNEKMEETIEWIKVKLREPTKEEIEDWEEIEPDIPIGQMVDCEMPEDGEEILIQTKYGVDTDTACIDEGHYLENMGDWEKVIAWARFPKGIEKVKNG